MTNWIWTHNESLITCFFLPLFGVHLNRFLALEEKTGKFVDCPASVVRTRAWLRRHHLVQYTVERAECDKIVALKCATQGLSF